MKDQHWMRHALQLAQRAFDLGEVPVGACLVRDDPLQGEQLLGEGWNQPISLHDPTAHAEIQALRTAAHSVQNYRLPNTTLYVTIEPCTMCLGALIHARVKRVVFGATEPKAGVLCSNQDLSQHEMYNHRLEWQGGILEQDCSALIQRFFQMRREQKKNQKQQQQIQQ